MTVLPVVKTLGSLQAGDTFVFNGDVTGVVCMRTDRVDGTNVAVVRLSDGALGNRDASEGVLVVPCKAEPV